MFCLKRSSVLKRECVDNRFELIIDFLSGFHESDKAGPVSGK